MSVTFGRTTPILRVADGDRALAWWTGVLGFAVEWGDAGFASVRRGEAVIMLAAGDQGQGGAWMYLGVDDVDALHAEIAPKGAIIRAGPADYPWGARELHVEDPDGNVIRFGAGATGSPIGEWVDARGLRWTYTAEGHWRPVD